MKTTLFTAIAAATVMTLAGCASPPTGASLASLPVVTYPARPVGGGDYVYKLPAGQRIDVRLLVEGSALNTGADQTISARLSHDLYLHKQWASEDGKRWVDRKDLIGVNLSVTLPSYEAPGPGEMRLSVQRKAPH